MKPLALTALSTVNAIGVGMAATAAGLRENRSGLRPCDFADAVLDTFIGRVDGVEDVSIGGNLAAFDCRNNRLGHMAVTADGVSDAIAGATSRYGADRVAVIVGTSTSGVREGEIAYAHRDPATGALPATYHFAETHDHHSLATYLQALLGLDGPAATVSTACSSSAKVFADAAQLIETGICDAAVVGGADSLCLLTLYGFNSLELLDAGPCRPNDTERAGISIGEAAGFALLERADAAGDRALAHFVGYGESADAHHMSAPHPEGIGAEMAMRKALERAGIGAADVDYINQHGTGSRQNDQVEDAAIARVFGPGMRCSSTKGATGHTLGAAGILEIAISVLAMRDGFLPANTNLRTLDPMFQSRVARKTQDSTVRHALNNSFGFGGSNCSILLARTS
jgi:3-oxoacyl-[acyl-carrier-protein] synthase-1